MKEHYFKSVLMTIIGELFHNPGIPHISQIYRFMKHPHMYGKSLWYISMLLPMTPLVVAFSND